MVVIIGFLILTASGISAVSVNTIIKRSFEYDCSILSSILPWPTVIDITQEQLICIKNKNTSFSMETISDLVLQSQHSSIMYFYPSVESEFLQIVFQLSRLFESLTTENTQTWKPKLFIYWPSTVNHFNNAQELHTNFKIVMDNCLRNESYFNSFLINSEVFIVLKGSNDRIFLYEIYKYKTMSCLKLVTTIVSKNNFYSNSNVGELAIYEYISKQPISTRRFNVSGVEISAVAQNDPDYQPRIEIKTYPNGTAEFTGGMCLKVLQELQFILEFSYKALDGKGWTGLFPNRSWTGMSGQVVNEEADIAIAQASTIMMTDQLHGISFLHSTSYGRLVGIFRQPPASSIRNVVTTAFKPLLWGCGFITWIILLLCIRLIFKISHDAFGDDVDGIFVSESIWWATSTTCSMGWHLTPDFRPLRVIFLSGCFLASFIFIAYSASLMTILSSESLPIQNFDDLSRSKINVFSDKWLPMAHHVVQEVYRSRNELNKRREDYYLLELDFAIPQILSKPWALITFADAISVVFHRFNYTDSYVCQMVHTVIVSKVPFPNSMFVKKGNPLKEILNIKILTMIERGFLFRHNKWYDTQTKLLCPTIVQHYRGGLVIKDVISPFLILFSGGILSIGILVLEKLRLKKVTLHERLELEVISADSTL